MSVHENGPPTLPDNVYERPSEVSTTVVDVQPDQFPDLTDDMVLYEDKTIKITKAGILLKSYYFPWAQDKLIPFSHILQVHVHNKFWTSSQWGLSDTKTWWTRDFGRMTGSAAIIIRTGSYLMKGFSPNGGDINTTKEVGDLLSKL